MLPFLFAIKPSHYTSQIHNYQTVRSVWFSVCEQCFLPEIYAHLIYSVA
uniref:Uncharacterized protein n=1 Tax=Arundo donax TaxID=35708 RepID=A0A0A9FGZ5_ARUDO